MYYTGISYYRNWLSYIIIYEYLELASNQVTYII